MRCNGKTTLVEDFLVFLFDDSEEEDEAERAEKIEDSTRGSLNHPRRGSSISKIGIFEEDDADDD